MLKKVVIITSILLCIPSPFSYSQNSSHDTIFTFSSYKATGGLSGPLSPEFLKQLIQLFGTTTFIETGTYDGSTTSVAKALFPNIHTIELDEALYLAAQKKFEPTPHIHCHFGESGVVLEKILPSITDKALIWLDAHYSGQGTAYGNNETPILEELDAIKNSSLEDCIILIDDIRGFGTRYQGKEFECWKNYPSLHQVCEKLVTINPKFNIVLIGDILLAYDQKYSVQVSAVVKACTVSRLETHESAQEATYNDSIIAQAQGREKMLVETLYNNKKYYKEDDEYHAHLWYGLILLHAKKYKDASVLFNHVIKHGYDNSRIHEYIKTICTRF